MLPARNPYSRGRNKICFQISKTRSGSYEIDLAKHNKLYRSHNHIYLNILGNVGRDIVYLSEVLYSIVSILKHKYITAYS